MNMNPSSSSGINYADMVKSVETIRNKYVNLIDVL